MRSPPVVRASVLLGAALLVPRAVFAQEPEVPSPPSKAPLLAIGLGHKHAFLPRSISHDAIGASFEVRPVPRAALGLAGALFAPFDQRYTQSPASWPLNRTLGTVTIEMKGFIAGGHERGQELYVLGAAGVIGTKPIALRDPWRRTFDYDAHLSFAMGLGGRFYLSKRIAAFAETRLTSFVAPVENGQVAPDGDPAISRSDESTWFGGKPLTAMVETQLGLLFFVSR